MAVPLLRGRFTVAAYQRLGELGVFHEDDRVELLDGQIVPMTPIGPRHTGCVRELIRLLSPLLAGAAVLDVQDPVVLNENDSPQPDLALLKPRVELRGQRNPTGDDTLLVIEVADSSADSDRLDKVPLYARAGIPEVWLVDLQNEHIEVYREPAHGTYVSVRSVPREETLTPLSLPHLTLKASDILV